MEILCITWDSRYGEFKLPVRVDLQGSAKFLHEKELAIPEHQPHIVRWVCEFQLFAQGHGGNTFEQTLDMFLAEIGKRGDSSHGRSNRRPTPFASIATNSAGQRTMGRLLA
jgi:hypothetical protein